MQNWESQHPYLSRLYPDPDEFKKNYGTISHPNQDYINNLISGLMGTTSIQAINKALPVISDAFIQSAGHGEDIVNNYIKQYLPEQTYYRSVPKQNYEDALAYGESKLQRHDPFFGKGYWFSHEPAHSRQYGEITEVAKTSDPIYDLNKMTDKEINDVWYRLKNRPREEWFSNDAFSDVNALHDIAKSKGYKGIKREGLHYLDKGYDETMFFNKPNTEPFNKIYDSQTHSYIHPDKAMEHLDNVENEMSKIYRDINEYNELISNYEKNVKGTEYYLPDVVPSFRYNLRLAEDKLKDIEYKQKHYQKLLGKR